MNANEHSPRAVSPSTSSAGAPVHHERTVPSVQELLTESDKMRELAFKLQPPGSEEPPRQTPRLSKQLRQQYERWYADALTLIDDASRDEFRNLYEGGTVVQRIRSFLAEPTARNFFYTVASEGIISPWKHPVQETFISSLDSQRAMLRHSAASSRSRASCRAVLEHLEPIMRRVPVFVKRLDERRNGERLTISNEYDFQDVLEALLRLHFDDVRPEEPTGSTAGSSARGDFLLQEAGVMVEAKMMRPSLTTKKLRDEIIVDQRLYREHKQSTALLVVVYDPDRRIRNPAAFETDLNGTGDLTTRVVVISGR